MSIKAPAAPAEEENRMTMEQIYSSVAVAIRGSGLSFAEISRRSGVAEPTIRQWCNGNSRGCHVVSLINPLDVLGYEIIVRRKRP